RASADAGDHGEVARLEPSGELSAMAVDPPRPEPDRDADAGVEGTAAGTEASGELAPGSGRACPREMAQVGPVCIDRWEAHLVARDSAGRLHQHPHNLRPPEAVWYAARSAPGVFPQAYISRSEARVACERAGKRLCSWLEWRR